MTKTTKSDSDSPKILITDPDPRPAGIGEALAWLNQKRKLEAEAAETFVVTHNLCGAPVTGPLDSAEIEGIALDLRCSACDERSGGAYDEVG